jgi:hypothetical protein
MNKMHPRLQKIVAMLGHSAPGKKKRYFDDEEYDKVKSKAQDETGEHKNILDGEFAGHKGTHQISAPHSSEGQIHEDMHPEDESDMGDEGPMTYEKKGLGDSEEAEQDENTDSAQEEDEEDNLGEKQDTGGYIHGTKGSSHPEGEHPGGGDGHHTQDLDGENDYIHGPHGASHPEGLHPGPHGTGDTYDSENEGDESYLHGPEGSHDEGEHPGQKKGRLFGKNGGLMKAIGGRRR